jgi:hypothetical protein
VTEVRARRKTDLCSICLAFRRALDKQEEFCKLFAKQHPGLVDSCGKNLEKWAKAIEHSNAWDAWQAAQLAEDIAAGSLHLEARKTGPAKETESQHWFHSSHCPRGRSALQQQLPQSGGRDSEAQEERHPDLHGLQGVREDRSPPPPQKAECSFKDQNESRRRNY